GTSNDRNNGRRTGGPDNVSGPRREERAERRDFGRNTPHDFGRSPVQQPAAPRVEPFEPSNDPGKPPQTLHVYAYGVARNRLVQAAKRMRLPVAAGEDLTNAQAVVTLKNYYRPRPKLIVHAERRG